MITATTNGQAMARSLPSDTSPLLSRCGLVPVEVDDSRWRRLIVWSDDLQKHSQLTLSHTGPGRLILAGGTQALTAIDDGLDMAAVRREMREARLRLIQDDVGREQRERGPV